MLKSFEEVKGQGSLNYEDFEQKRLEAQAKNKKGLMLGGGIGGGIALIGIIMLLAGSSAGVALIILGIIVFVVYFIIVNSKAKKELKGKILGDIVKGIDASYSYSKGDREFIPQFRKAGFIKSRAQTSVDDVFLGQINGKNFGLGEMTIKQKRTRGNTTTYITVFQGPFAHIDADKDYGFTSIIPDTMEKALGGVGRLLQKADVTRLNQKLLKIDEDPTFEKHFAVWSKDPETTKQILNPEFRNYLIGLATMSKTYVGWRDNKIYMAINNGRDLFTLKLKNAITESTVRQFYDDFATYYNVLENVHSYVTTGMGTGSNVASPLDNSNDAPPPPPAGNDAPPPPPQ